MTTSEIREIVRLTIEELERSRLLKTVEYPQMLKVVEKKLYNFFSTKKEKDKSISYALRQVADDPYIDIILLQYRDRETLEDIAEYFERDVSTIKRNKKRLIKNIYDLL